MGQMPQEPFRPETDAATPLKNLKLPRGFTEMVFREKSVKFRGALHPSFLFQAKR
ncbi:MAG: hypothetical protein K8R69_03390 [Deltaproteobacteria bacterium]|nr:hypothetical protein [Deltaproteobacteria bacterium]